MTTNGKADPAIAIANPAPRPRGLKGTVASVPGAVEAHRIYKNLRGWARWRWRTHGGIKRSSLSIDEAVDYTADIFGKVDSIVARNGTWSGARVLEVGPGDSLGTGTWCLGAGASSYTAIDRFDVAFDPDFERAVQEEIGRRLGSGVDADAGERIVYRNDLPIEAAPAALGVSSRDVIFSNAVLEHVADLRGAFEAFRDLLAPGGVMFHDVDLRSHQSFERHPLAFLEYPDWFWRLMSSHNGEPNRVRLPGYVAHLRELGFVDIAVDVTRRFDPELVRRVQGRLAVPFRRLDPADLEPAVFTLSARLPD